MSAVAHLVVEGQAPEEGAERNLFIPVPEGAGFHDIPPPFPLTDACADQRLLPSDGPASASDIFIGQAHSGAYHQPP